VLQARVLRVQLDHGLDEVAEHAHQVMRLLCDVAPNGLDGVGHLLRVLLQQHDQNRFLVREVLIQGADRNPGPLGDAVGRRPGVAALFENASRRLHDLSDGEARPALRRLLPGV